MLFADRPLHDCERCSHRTKPELYIEDSGLENILMGGAYIVGLDINLVMWMPCMQL